MRILRGLAATIMLLVFCTAALPNAESADRGRGDRFDGADAAAVPPPVACGVLMAQAPKKGSQAGGESWTRREERVVYGGDEPTKVQIRGNSILVPVTLAYGNNEVDANFLLDTGAGATMINTDVADRLHMDLTRTKKARVQVVGGGVVEARVVPVTRLTVGPHSKRDLSVLVIPHKGPTVRYDGLLGMDVLRGLQYRVDFKRKVIVWE